MPKLTLALPKYRRHSSRNVAFCEVQGRRKYFPGAYGSSESKEAFRRFLIEWETEGRPAAPPPPEGETVTITELVSAWWKHAQTWYLKDGVPTGTTENFRPILRLLREVYGSVDVREFRPRCLEAIQKKLIDAGHARRYINDNVDRIRLIVRWGVSKELVPIDVLQRLETVPCLRKGRSGARENPPVEPVDDATIDAVLPRLPHVVRTMLELQRQTGMRPGELCILRPRDVDRSRDVWLYRPSSHKCQHHGKDRVVPLGPKSQALLAPYLLRDHDAFCFSPREAAQERREARTAARSTPASCGNVVGSNVKTKPKRRPGDKYTNDSYRRAITRAAKAAGVEPFAPNRVRHTTATELRKKYGIEAAMTTLGHSRLSTTEVYAEKNLSLAERIAREVG